MSLMRPDMPAGPIERKCSVSNGPVAAAGASACLPMTDAPAKTITPRAKMKSEGAEAPRQGTMRRKCLMKTASKGCGTECRGLYKRRSPVRGARTHATLSRLSFAITILALAGGLARIDSVSLSTVSAMPEVVRLPAGDYVIYAKVDATNYHLQSASYSFTLQ